MTNINIAINGLGRIGKLLLRELMDRDMNVSLVNDGPVTLLLDSQRRF